MERGFQGTTLEEALASAKLIYDEDLRVLNSLRPREVPFSGGSPEVSVPADRYTLAYRRTFLEFVRRALDMNFPPRKVAIPASGTES